MAKNIKHAGMINFIEVDEDYMIITGEQRWKAAKIAGLTEVPCKILKLDPRKRFFRQLSENICHSGMNDYDIAKSLEKLLDSDLFQPLKKRGRPNKKHIAELSEMLGKSTGWITTKLSILEEKKEIIQAIKKGEITADKLASVKYAPREFREEIKDKILLGEIVNRDSIREIGRALRRAPNKTNEILGKDYSDMSATDVIAYMRRIAPSEADLALQEVERSEDGKSLWDIISKLENELDRWPANKISDQIRPMVGMAFGSLILKLNKYIEASHQLTLENGDK